MRTFILHILAGLLILSFAGGPIHAQERSATRQGFALPAKSGKKILLMRPTMRVGEQSTGGMFEPNSDWTEQARANIGIALDGLQRSLGNDVIIAPPAYGEDARALNEHMALFAAVSQAVIQYQFFVGNRLPTKKRDNKAEVFDWSLGEGVGNLPGAEGADYALFIYNRDVYGSTGRKMLQLVGALAGVGVSSGEHVGYAGLVDLKTGELLWLNADAQMGGDVREKDGAEKRIRQLLEDFPGSMIAESETAPDAGPGK
ncbi:hypothetical protein [Blastomonas fulva]|uniref:hypothetical protein n=1 Tax=Blastomonas fulva TaxID=1550728 RepID=UPI003F6E9719